MNREGAKDAKKEKEEDTVLYLPSSANASSRFVQIIKKNPRIINLKSLNSGIFKKIVFGDINRRSQFLDSPIQVARNRPNYTRREPIAPVDRAETSLLLAVRLAPRHTLAVLKIGGI
jgi:hypothetical protein